MESNLRGLLAGITSKGWTVDIKTTPQPSTPEVITLRYGSLPQQFASFLSSVQKCINKPDTAWILCDVDYAGRSDRAFTWNEFENISLEAFAADGDDTSEIEQFWDAHLPVAMSVGSHYAYLALRMADGKVVYGEEPEFEEAKVVAGSFYELLEMLGSEGDIPWELTLFR